MESIDEQVRQRLGRWLKANKGRITQDDLADAAGRSQPWVSGYLSGSKEKPPTFDELDAMARVFEHSINELFDAQLPPDEQDLLDGYRAIRAERRAFARQTLRHFAPSDSGPKRRRLRSDG